MQITCPKCGYSKSVDPTRVPARPVKVSCPRCSEAFSFDRNARGGQQAATTAPRQRRVETITCPACGLEQEKRESCRGCGVIYERFQARRGGSGGSATARAAVDPVSELRNGLHAATLQLQPKAGFWIRVVAYLLDSLLLGIVQFVLGLLIGVVLGMLGLSAEGDQGIKVVLWLFGVALSLGYAVFFVGYCGQTPGKMALRIKVIRTDGRAMSYGRAALREVFGKFISALLLGIGYLMVAFDSNKQGLHDRIADTYVVKL
jgi:predicted Zn finger-like uncharacterized protein